MPLCSKCRQEKENMHSPKTCKECAEMGKKYYHNNKEKQAKTNKIWRSKENGKAIQQAANKRWRENNHDRYLELARGYSAKYGITPSYRWTKAKYTAKNRKLTFDISLEAYSKLIEMPCYYCNGVLGHVMKGIGLDRIDSSKGYIVNNVISCCKICNMLKGDTFTMEETKIAVGAILTFRATQSLKDPIQS